MNVKSALQHTVKNWKTTVSGVLTALIGFSAVASTPNPWISSAVGVKILGAAAIAKVVLGLMQTDGKQLPDEKKGE